MVGFFVSYYSAVVGYPYEYKRNLYFVVCHFVIVYNRISVGKFILLYCPSQYYIWLQLLKHYYFVIDSEPLFVLVIIIILYLTDQNPRQNTLQNNFCFSYHILKSVAVFAVGKCGPASMRFKLWVCSVWKLGHYCTINIISLCGIHRSVYEWRMEDESIGSFIIKTQVWGVLRRGGRCKRSKDDGIRFVYNGAPPVMCNYTYYIVFEWRISTKFFLCIAYKKSEVQYHYWQKWINSNYQLTWKIYFEVLLWMSKLN